MTQITPTYLKDYEAPHFAITHVFLDFDVQADYTRVKSTLHCEKKKDAPLVLDGEALTLESVSIDGVKLTNAQFKQTDTHLTIHQVPQTFTLETIVTIHPKKNTELSGLYQSRSNLCTQCEAEGFRRITYSLDRPDVMSVFTVTIEADKKQYPYLLSNGNLVEEKELDGNRHFVKWEDPSKKSCYLFALVAGDFDVIQDSFHTMHNRNIDLYFYLEKGFRDQGDYAVTALKKSMQWDEEKFGREYDLDRFMIVAVSDFNMGAMENKGLNIFNTKYILAKPQTATDTDYVNIERVIGHEYFHNWSGNRVTCRDWFQLTLKEGLTVLRDQLFTEDMTSCGVARIDVVNTLRNHQFPEDAGPMAHPIRPDNYLKIDNFYTATVYEKGAEVLRMVRTLLTPEIFRKGMDLYFSRYDGQAVTTEDFLQAMVDASGKDLSQFSRWYHQAGTPVLRVKTHYDAASKKYTLTIKQSAPETPDQKEKLPLHMPFAFGLIGSDCKDVFETKILDIKKPEETFVFDNIAENAAPSLLRHFSAPVELQYDYTNEQLALLFQCDSDPFARYEAGQRLLVNMIHAVAKDMVFDKPVSVPALLIHTFKSLLSQNIEDPNLFSRLLMFPSLKYLLSQIEKIDLDIVHRAKLFLETAVATQLEPQWLALYKHYQLTGDYTYDNHSCGYRRLKNQCLMYLLKSAHKLQHVEKAYYQATKADNMTDQFAALMALNDCDVSQRESALSHFYAQYQHEPLVVNKWLSLQAATTLPQVLSDIQKLLQHPAYDQHNPNNVYALLVTFGENTPCFHDKNGQGYQLLANQVLALDALNPQVSSRVVRPLTQWKQMDAIRRVMMQAELKHILESKKLSDNLFEIVSKSVL
jgi:aminopeptidase N